MILSYNSKIEDIYNEFKECTHSITITLKPHVYNRRAYIQYRLSCPKLMEILEIYTSKYIMVPELTKKGNIHYHLIVQFNSKMEYPVEKLMDLMKCHRLFGAYVNDHTISCYQEFVKVYFYITKEIQKTASIMNVPIDDILIFKNKIIHKKKISNNILYNILDAGVLQTQDLSKEEIC